MFIGVATFLCDAATSCHRNPNRLSVHELHGAVLGVIQRRNNAQASSLDEVRDIVITLRRGKQDNSRSEKFFRFFLENPRKIFAFFRTFAQ